jgi:transcriptional regulator with XRE-family HTH domain
MGKIYLSQNLRHLRKTDGRRPTQSDMAAMLGVSISTYGAYEEGRAEPKLENLQKITGFFGIEMEVLLSRDLTLGEARGEGQMQKREGEVLVQEAGAATRVLAITVDAEGRDNVEWVPEKAAAGYTAGFGDPGFISTLLSFHLPFLDKRKKYRVFTIQGDSMLPIPSGSMVFGEYVEDWNSVKDGTPCVLVTRSEGIVFKKVYNYLKQQHCLLLVSANRQYEPYLLGADEILEMWRFSAYYSGEFPEEIRWS